MKQIALINPENVTDKDAVKYPLRHASRAVVLNNENKIALLHVRKLNYFKLPGGGIEENEDKIGALIRECKEEIGCEIDVISEIGSIMEYRKIFQIRQMSYCYLAKVIGKRGQPKFTDEENENGFVSIWIPINEAIIKLKECKTTDIEGRDYIVPRDLLFLQNVKL